MVAISIMIEGQDGLNWSQWKRLVTEVENLGFAGLFRSDHFTNAQPPDKDSLEAIVSLTYLADHTKHIHFGPLVSPLTFRHPTLLARQAAAINDLSEGRMILGLGAGWQEREHQLFGHPLFSISERMARFEEGLNVITLLLGSDEPVSFEGRFFQLRGATLLPRPEYGSGPRILIGGNGPKRTLPLVARYADIWNAVFVSPQQFGELSAQLDVQLEQAERRPQEVKRTVMVGLTFARDRAELEHKLAETRQKAAFAQDSLERVVEHLHNSGGGIVGTPDIIIQQLQNYERAGVSELMLQWLDLEHLDDLKAFAQAVLH